MNENELRIITQDVLNNMWKQLKEGKFIIPDYPPSIDVDDEVEQVMTIPFPGPEFGGITVRRKNKESDWELL